ncbi:hypothetical protein C8J56DRAFT_319882 [Mycena floridula]|nr:hypothetical protein C8J56DRAFT_319882 [Mycena floridula]
MSLEKRGRIREKEQLQHNQYQLKTRIEELKRMDGNPFMSLDASYFSAPPPESEMAHADAEDDDPYDEGQRRRDEMLEVAEALAARYRTLLPPNRPPKAGNKNLQIPEIEGFVEQPIADEAPPSPSLSPVPHDFEQDMESQPTIIPPPPPPPPPPEIAATPPAVEFPETHETAPISPAPAPSPSPSPSPAPKRGRGRPPHKKIPSPAVESMSNPEVAELENQAVENESLSKRNSSTSGRNQKKKKKTKKKDVNEEITGEDAHVPRGRRRANQDDEDESPFPSPLHQRKSTSKRQRPTEDADVEDNVAEEVPIEAGSPSPAAVSGKKGNRRRVKVDANDEKAEPAPVQRQRSKKADPSVITEPEVHQRSQRNRRPPKRPDADPDDHKQSDDESTNRPVRKRQKKSVSTAPRGSTVDSIPGARRISGPAPRARPSVSAKLPGCLVSAADHSAGSVQRAARNNTAFGAKQSSVFAKKTAEEYQLPSLFVADIDIRRLHDSDTASESSLSSAMSD